MNKNIYLIFGIIILLSLTFVNAWSTNVFYNGTTSYTSENVTLNNNFERYLKVPTGTYLINAYLNLTGYNSNIYGSYVSSFYVGTGGGARIGIAKNNTNYFFTTTTGNVHVYNSNLEFIDDTFSFAGELTDGNGIITNDTFFWIVGATQDKVCKYYKNYTLTSTGCWNLHEVGTPLGLASNNSNIFVSDISTGRFTKYDMSGNYISNFTMQSSDGDGIAVNGSNYFIQSYLKQTISKYNFSGGYVSNFSLNINSNYANGLTMNETYFYSLDYTDSTVYIYNNKGVRAYPSDTLFGYAETNFYYLPAGEFNTTNRTTNLATGINTALNNGCTCSECILSGGYCSIPFIFNFTGDAGGILSYSDLIFSDIGLTENSQTYNPTTTSGKTETFIINFTYSSYTYTSVSGKLNYNGTIYTGTLSGSGNTRLLTTTLTTPNSTGTYPFYWNISLTNSSGVNYFKSNNYTQSINPLIMNRCNSVYNVTFINFTVKDAETPTTLIPSKFKVTFNYGSGNTGTTYSYQETAETNSSFPFCFLPSDLTYLVDASIEYEATGYSKNYYYLNDVSLTNATSNITLYLLNSSKATLTVLKAQTDTQTALENVYIQIQRYDTGTDTYYTVGMAKTDYNGEDLAYLNWYNTFYKYILVQDGSVIYIAPSSKIISSPVTFTIPSTISFDYDKFLNIVYTLTFNNATGNFVLTYSIPSGGITSACLRVDKRTIKNDTLICNTCETSSSATIYCNINAYGNGTYIATFYAKGSLGFIESITEFIGAVNKLYDLIGNVDGTMYAILFSALCMVMFFISPVLGIVGMLLGMIGGMALGFQPVNYMEFLGIGIVGIIVMMILKR